MGEEEESASATPRRGRTRSSAADPPLTPLSESQTTSSTSPETLIPDDSISLDDLFSRLPGRRSQIIHIIQLLGPVDSPMLPILVYGGACTGKTTTVSHILRHLRRPIVYTSLRTCYSPTLFFDSVLNQLLHHKRSSVNAYASAAKKCDRLSDFVTLLREALSKRLQSSSSCKGKNMIYFVFDNVELLRTREKVFSGLSSVLFRIHDLLRIPKLGFIYISRASPDTYYSSYGTIEPIPVHFPDYSANDLYEIFMRDHACPKIYSTFLSVALKPFCRITRRVDELSIVLNPLFKKYCDPLHGNLSVTPDEGTKRRLFNHIQPHLTAALNETFEVPSLPSRRGKRSMKDDFSITSRKDDLNNLGFHLPVSAKYLLISAFLASRNPATLDDALFDSSGITNDRKHKSKSSNNKKDEASEHSLMKGLGSFPLERLLAIYQCITSIVEAEPGEEEGKLQRDGLYNENNNQETTGFMADVLLQLSTLCNANFVARSVNCSLEGSTRLRATIDTDFALKVARSINFPLYNYLYRR